MTTAILKLLEERQAERAANEEAERMAAAERATAQRIRQVLLGKWLAANATDDEIRQEFPGISDDDLNKVRVDRLRELITCLPKQCADRLVAELPNRKESDFYFAILGDMNDADLLSYYSERTLDLSQQLVVNHLKENEESVSGPQLALDLNESQGTTPTPSPLAPPTAKAPVHQEPVNEPPNELLDALTPNQVKLLKFLWSQPHSVVWDSLPNDAFRDEGNRCDSAVKRALEHLQQRLNALYDRFGLVLENKPTNRRVKLIKDSRTSSDNSTDK